MIGESRWFESIRVYHGRLAKSGKASGLHPDTGGSNPSPTTIRTAISFNGRTTPSHGENRGSTPRIATMSSRERASDASENGILPVVQTVTGIQKTGRLLHGDVEGAGTPHLIFNQDFAGSIPVVATIRWDLRKRHAACFGNRKSSVQIRQSQPRGCGLKAGHLLREQGIK